MNTETQSLPEHQRLANRILELSRARLVRNQNFTWSLRIRGSFKQEHFQTKDAAERHRINQIQNAAQQLIRIAPHLEEKGGDT